MLRAVHLSLRAKLILLCVALITVPFSFIGFTTYYKYTDNEKQKSASYAEQLTRQIEINLDRFVKDLDRITLTPFYDEAIMSILRDHSQAYRAKSSFRVDEQLKMSSFLKALAYDRNEIRGITFFSVDGAIFSNLDLLNIRIQWDPTEESWLQEIIALDGRPLVLAPHQIDYYLDHPTGTSTTETQTVSYARMIKDPVTEVNLAVMKIDIKPSGLESVFSAVKVTPNSILHIMAANGKAIYAQTPVEPRETEDNKAVQFSSRSDYTGLTVSLQIPHEDLTRDARELTGFVFAISVITVVIALVLSIWGSNILIRPIRHLQFMMRIVREGTLNKRAKVMTYDEIGLLTEDFNRMVDEIERLIHEVYETKLRERDSDLAALQSQINPHFLYNTLETINMMAIRQSNLQISSTVSSLGKLLRYTVDNKEKHVYMREEFRFVDAYLQIQSTRLEGRLQVNWKTLPRFDYCLVPKLFLQPFVENAIEHGLGNHAVLALTISALEEEGHLLISVSDNGVGMSEGQMDELEKRLIARLPSIVERDTFEKPKHGFALRNVHQRISLLYGDGYGVSIDRQAPAGCTFIIRLPKVEEEQNDV